MSFLGLCRALFFEMGFELWVYGCGIMLWCCLTLVFGCFRTPHAARKSQLILGVALILGEGD